MSRNRRFRIICAFSGNQTSFASGNKEGKDGIACTASRCVASTTGLHIMSGSGGTDLMFWAST